MGGPCHAVTSPPWSPIVHSLVHVSSPALPQGEQAEQFSQPKENSEPVQLLSISCFISACGLFNLLIVGKNNKRSSADLPSFPCL